MYRDLGISLVFNNAKSIALFLFSLNFFFHKKLYVLYRLTALFFSAFQIVKLFLKPYENQETKFKVFQPNIQLEKMISQICLYTFLEHHDLCVTLFVSFVFTSICVYSVIRVVQHLQNTKF